MKAIEVNIIQRLKLAAAVGSQNGNVQQMRQLSKLLDSLEFTAQEKEEIKLREVADPAGTTGLFWDQTATNVYSIQLEDSDAARLKSVIERYEGWVASQDRRWVEAVLYRLS